MVVSVSAIGGAVPPERREIANLDVSLANWICDVLDNPSDENVIAGVRENVEKQCAKFPVYGT